LHEYIPNTIGAAGKHEETQGLHGWRRETYDDEIWQLSWGSVPYERKRADWSGHGYEFKYTIWTVLFTTE
jgi:hypothetical protein